MRRPRSFLTALIAIVVMLGIGAAGAAGAPAKAPAKSHINPYSIEGQFMCVSCHEPLNQVNSSEAQAEKAALTQFAAQGMNVAQIKSAMVDAFGDDVLGRPPAKGFNLLIYVVPPLVIVLALALIVLSLPKWRARARAQALARPRLAPVINQADADRLNQELDDFDG